MDGAQGRNRTTDTAIFSRMLYQLSYLGAGAPRRCGCGFIGTAGRVVQSDFSPRALARRSPLRARLRGAPFYRVP